ncbi:hypothetical protein NVIRPANT_00293 [Pantoea sp. Nvir]|nr:hypothetical protein NVIRPANT_00293 [Pantoea sp. Nvir]
MPVVKKNQEATWEVNKKITIFLYREDVTRISISLATSILLG